MAELQFKVGDSPNGMWHDRDCRAAVSDARIRREHCWLNCLPMGDVKTVNGVKTRRFARETTDGLLPINDVGRDLMEATHETRFERTGLKSFRVTRLSDGETIEVPDDRPYQWFDGRLVAMDVRLKMARRDKMGRKGIVFGQRGREVWYGGRIDFSPNRIEQVVPELRDKVGIDLDEPDFQLWPWGRRSIRDFVVVRSVALSDAEVEALTAPHYQLDDDGEPVLDERGRPIVVARRNIQLQSWDLVLGDLEETIEHVQDREYPIGVDDVPLPLGRLVSQSKPQPAQQAADKLWVKSEGRPGQREAS